MIPDASTSNLVSQRLPTGRGILIGLALLALSAAGAATVWLYAAAPVRPLRVAINPWPGFEFAMLAVDLGFFRDEGVDAQLIELSCLSDARRAFDRGQVDGFFATVVDVLMSRESAERNAQIVLVTDYSNGADVVLAAPPIRSVAELRGARVGIEQHTLGEYVLTRALDAAGMEPNDVVIAHVSPLDMAAALKSGQVVAVVTYPPASVDIVRAGLAAPVFSSAAIPGEVVDVLAFDEPIIRERGAEVAAVIRAFHRAQQHAARHPEESIRMMAARERVGPDEFLTALTDGVVLVDAGGQASYFGSSGLLSQVVENSVRALGRISGLRRGPIAPGDIIADGAPR